MEAPLSRLKETLGTVGAEIKKRDEWGKRKLAYTIDGQNFGIYVFYVIELEPPKVNDLEQALQLNEEVIRHLIVTYQEEEEENNESSDVAAQSDSSETADKGE